MTSVAVIMLTYYCANIMLGLGLLKRHEDLVAQREKHEQFTKECEERMKKWERKYPDVDAKKIEENQNKVEQIIYPEVLLSIGRDEQGRLMRIEQRDLRAENAAHGTDFDAWLKEQHDWMKANGLED